MWHHGQRLQQHALHIAYKREEGFFVNPVTRVPRPFVSNESNIISSQKLSKIKVNDDFSLSLKTRIAPHGNGYSVIADMRFHCFMCLPIGVLVVQSNVGLQELRVVKLDVNSAFVLSGPAWCDVYAILPREPSYCNEILLLQILPMVSLTQMPSGKWSLALPSRLSGAIPFLKWLRFLW